MAQTKFTIPEEFKDQIQFRPCKDTRSDDVILKYLSQLQPVTSEKNIWAFWDKGLAAAPEWCKHNILNWTRVNSPSGWTIRILDAIPTSPNYALNYVSKDLLPQAFVEGKMEGPYVGPHSSDFLRGACLYTHGGVYLDVGIILIREMDRICWAQLEDESSPFRVSVPWMYGTTMANHFVAARKGDPFIKRWHDLFIHLWANHTSHSGIAATPLFAPLQENISFESSRASNFNWDFAVEPGVVFEYIAQVLCWARLCMLEGNPDTDAFNGVEYWTKHVLIFDVLEECWRGERTLGFKNFGENMFKAMSVRVDADPQTEEYRDAYRLTWELLTQASLQKITHGKGLTHDIHLGVLWDQNPGKDCEKGTFGELLRYGQDNFVQTRETIRYVEAPRPGKTLKKAVLEV